MLLTECVVMFHGNVETVAYSGPLDQPKLDYTICADPIIMLMTLQNHYINTRGTF
jgi:hypothetical protein